MMWATFITTYGFEIFLEVSHESRNRKELLEDLNESGIETYPPIIPYLLINSKVLNGIEAGFLPLGGVSNTTTFFTNELGYFPIIKTDEHGFNNPSGLYEKSEVDIVLTGDSFAEGYSVHSNETISAVLRKSGFNTISIGKGGNGPLLKLAALREYARFIKPKVVLWLYYANDLLQIETEMTSLILKKYLSEDDFTQNLMSRQGKIDRVLKNYIQVEWENEKRSEKEERKNDGINNWVSRIIKLYNLRSRVNFMPTLADTTGVGSYATLPAIKPATKLIFKDVLQKSKQLVSGWGGKMYFINLDEYRAYFIGKDNLYYDFILDTNKELGIPIIDIHKEVFKSHEDPLSLFPFRKQGHYNAKGYRLIAEEIKKRLEADVYVR